MVSDPRSAMSAVHLLLLDHTDPHGAHQAIRSYDRKSKHGLRLAKTDPGTWGKDAMTGTRGTPAERLLRALVRQPNGCLEWTLTTDSNGYGRLKVNGRNVRTSRLAWELAHGPILAGLHVLHHCDNPLCCETDPTDGYPEGHLFLGTQADNMADMAAKGRHRTNGNEEKSHCPQDHEYIEANTYVDSKGKRSCRICRREAVARYRSNGRKETAL